MSWIIGIFTAILIIDCVFLILLVLIQLPKKEAGLGTAFGGGATDALFGAGSGNALTKMTKYTTGIFFVLTLTLSVLNAQHAKMKGTKFEKLIPLAQPPPPPVAPANPSDVPAAPLTNSLLTETNTAPAPEKPVTPPGTPPEPATPATPDKPKN